MPRPPYTPADIERVTLVLGMEIHVELATRTKVFSRAANPAASRAASAASPASSAHHPSSPSGERAAPNTLIDPVVLALPGSLPVLNREAVHMSMLVGRALGCTIAERTKWDRKSYFYPDLPKAYQISQYDMPLCFDGAIDIPNCDERGEPDPLKGFARIGIIRAHLEEDAGKLMHELPAADSRGGSTRIDHSIVDLNRAGAPLLEIVTQPDFTSADQAVAFARLLRMTCRFLGITEGIMQKGHMRFEPNINCIIYLNNGRTAKTPITEVKNLNSFRSLKGAIEHELKEQPRRWLEDGIEFGPGTKSTRGWNDARSETFLQREKEDAHDYRYFPDPDLPVLEIDEAWRERVRASIPELPISRLWRCREKYGLDAREALALIEERPVAEFYDQAIEHAVSGGVPGDRAGRLVANLLLQNGAKRVNERAAARPSDDADSDESGADSLTLTVADLGITPAAVGALAALRERGDISANSLDELFGLLCDPAHAGADPETLARERNLMVVRDTTAMEKWCGEVLAENAAIVEQIKGGKLQAVGRLVGNVMKLSGGSADAAQVRKKLLDMIGVKE